MKTPNFQKYNKIETVSVGFETLLFRDLCFSFEVKKKGSKNFSNVLITVPQHVNIAFCCMDSKCQ